MRAAGTWSMMPWNAISRIGGINVMLPAAFAVAAWLCAQHDWRMVRWWCGLVAGLLAVTVATKICFIGWGFGIRSLDFTGLSGHAARAAAILPVIFFLVLQGNSPRSRAFGVLLGLAGSVLVCIARVKLHAHSVSEVIGGAVLGAGAAAVFIHVFGPARPMVWQRPLALACLLGLTAASFLTPAPTQRWMIASALYLSGHDRPYIRQGWRPAPHAWAHPQALVNARRERR